MKMIVGLGNIGKEYDKTRHNTGFMVIDELAKKHDINNFKVQSDALIADFRVNGEKVLLVKPTTYMNDSGRAVRPLMDYYDVDLNDMIVAYDDMDMPVGKIRLRQKGSAGGHNGIKSIIAHVGTQSFNRVRIGIDHPTKESVVDYVLGKFRKEQITDFEIGVQNAVAALEDWTTIENFSQLMNKYN
ncbi:aminoacyl-tRNA hydrolase [Pediococcus pentosaceus]|uniref:Peptidyl-tRNA hydrolase n=1 Tax=Pediococcus pentosaceus TaxID=1255 RepID=A0ABD7X558_PEDPE|nr:aminoacyl-tRNA hydrolase [Pediococcus pentosaceus]AXR44006.1 aminoacyl-tRNA hydrolase [Pediococcus pentosaceus]KAF0519558.1 aminoacyl-tRNA hydrolase [Pediococcus pentosaceus]MBF7111064.1 aminoacyl-tRNA hydrolase [Pediococcus pentosaceus]MBF7116299.1 aminoacyl-tRNA hydrolase [Pediococcus pentosaceus]MBF7118037.1 aminoacyl-tRNA hydrolase [Pediococcus pentosaceus]